MKTIINTVFEVAKSKFQNIVSTNIHEMLDKFKDMGVFKESGNILKYKPLASQTIIINKMLNSLKISVGYVTYSGRNTDMDDLNEAAVKCVKVIEEDLKLRKNLKKLGATKVYCVVYFTQSPVDGAKIQEMSAKDVAKFIEDYGYPVEVYASNSSANKILKAINFIADNFDGETVYNSSYVYKNLDDVRKTVKDRLV